MSWTVYIQGITTPASTSGTTWQLNQSGTFASTDVLTSITVSASGYAQGTPGGYATITVNGLTINLSASGSGSISTLSASKSFTLSQLSGAAAIAGNWQRPVAVFTGYGPAGSSAVISNLTITVTTATNSTGVPADGGNPIPTSTSSPYQYQFLWREQPPSSAAFTTGYTATVHLWKNATGTNGTSTTGISSLSGTATLKLLSANGTACSMTIGATTATSHTITFTSGVSTQTVTFPTNVETGPFYLEVSSFVYSGTGAANPPALRTTAFNIAAANGPHLDFGTAPVNTVQVGDIMTTFTVRARSAAMATVTSFTGNVTVEAVIGSETQSGVLNGTTTVAAVAGVATFSTISFLKPGVYQIKASATGYTEVFSVAITAIGAFAADDLVGLRQNIKGDGTTWRKTTNISSPTLSATTVTENGYIDGDMASTNSVTTDGFRWYFPHTIKLQRIDYKVAVSTLSGSPYISVYTSNDATSVTTGTWTLQASFTPITTNIFISAFTFATPLIAKGVWVTLNDNGGAATAAWKAIHVTGPYLSPSISYADQNTAAVLANENTLSIPYPPEKISGTATETRTVLMKNNTSTSYEVICQVAKARSSTDSLITNHVTVKDSNGDAIAGQFVLNAYESKPLTFSYTISSSDNDNSGKHYIRVTMVTFSEATALWYYVGTSVGVRWYDMATFTSSTSQSTGGETYTDVMYHGATASKMYVSNDAGTNFYVAGISGASDWAKHTITAAGTAANFSRGVIMGDYAYITNSANTNIYKVPLVSTNTSTALSSIAIPFTIAAGTSGAKHTVARDATRMWIANGTTSDISIYDYDTSGNLYNTITTVTNLSGRTINTMAWDRVNGHLYVITTVSGGARIIARYDSSGTWISNSSNSDRSTLEATGAACMNGKLYIFYGGRYVWRYDLQTLANSSELADLSANTGTGRVIITAE